MNAGRLNDVEVTSNAGLIHASCCLTFRPPSQLERLPSRSSIIIRASPKSPWMSSLCRQLYLSRWFLFVFLNWRLIPVSHRPTSMIANVSVMHNSPWKFTSCPQEFLLFLGVCAAFEPSSDVQRWRVCYRKKGHVFCFYSHDPKMTRYHCTARCKDSKEAFTVCSVNDKRFKTKSWTVNM